MYKVGFEKRKKLIDSSSYGWFFLFRTFQSWYKVMSDTCYILSPLFFIFASVKLLQTLRLLQNFLLYYYYSNVFPQKQRKKLLMKIVEHKLEEAVSNSIRGDVQLGRLILLNVPISRQFPRLTSLHFFSFLKWPLKLDWTFPWQQSSGSEQLITPESWETDPCK